MLSCYRYIELNPVRAGIVEYPAEYRWSSYGANAQGQKCDFLSAHEVYCGLGKNINERLRAYRELFRSHLEPGIIDEIRKSTNGNYALGTERFCQQVEEALGRRVVPGKPGRPGKQRIARY